MAVTTEQATVYRGGGRRWFSLRAAVKAEAQAIIKAKHPSERPEYENGMCYYPGFHWRELPRSDVLLRRLCRLILAEHAHGVEGLDATKPCAHSSAGGWPLPARCERCKDDRTKCDNGRAAGVAAVHAPLTDERILHLWDAHVAYETGYKGAHLKNTDKLAFARAVLAAAGVKGPQHG
jgi:hypothetical protein